MSTHENDNNIAESPTGWYVWTLNIDQSLLEKVKNHGWSIFKIQQISPNSINDEDMINENQENLCNNWQTTSSFIITKGFWLNTIEIYGTVLAVPNEKQQVFYFI